MRILHVTRSADPRGGGPIEGIRRHAELAAAAGRPLTVASFDDPAQRLDIPGAETIALGRGWGKYGYQPGAVARLRALAERHDVVVINGLWQYHALAARSACLGRTPYAVFPHGMLGGWFNERYPLKALKKRLYWRLGDYRVLRDAAAVCFTTEGERLQASASFSPYRARATVVGYGTAAPPPTTPAHAAAFAAACPLPMGRRHLLFLSRLHEVKGCDLLLAAFAAIAEHRPDLDLVMAGPDPHDLGEGLRAQARALGIATRVHWPGMLAGDAKWGAFRSAEAYVLPSHHENFGVAVAEALACGVPVLISDQVGIWREIVGDGAGLAGPDDQAGTTDALERWIRVPEAGRTEMREAARRCFATRFAIGIAVERLEKVLQAVVDGHPPAATDGDPR